MTHSFPHFNLYCLNPDCQRSVLKDMQTVQVAFTEENLIAEHKCVLCKQPLVSAADIMIEQLVWGKGYLASN